MSMIAVFEAGLSPHAKLASATLEKWITLQRPPILDSII